MFRVKLVYNETDFLMLSRVTRWPRDGGRKHPVLRKLGLVAGILLAAIAIAAGIRACTYEISSVFSGGGYTPNAFDGLGVVLFASVGLSLIFRNSNWIWKKAAWKAYKEKGTELEFFFSQDGFTVTVPTCSSDFSYAGIARIYEDPDYFVLILPAGTSYVLRKSAFIEGDPAVFGPWLAQQTGKQLIQV